MRLYSAKSFMVTLILLAGSPAHAKSEKPPVVSPHVLNEVEGSKPNIIVFLADDIGWEDARSAIQRTGCVRHRARREITGPFTIGSYFFSHADGFGSIDFGAAVLGRQSQIMGVHRIAGSCMFSLYAGKVLPGAWLESLGR